VSYTPNVTVVLFASSSRKCEWNLILSFFSVKCFFHFFSLFFIFYYLFPCFLLFFFSKFNEPPLFRGKNEKLAIFFFYYLFSFFL